MLERARNAEKAESQWSTLKSGPLATWEKDEKGPKCREIRELVDHFEEWTTSYMGKGRKGLKNAEKAESQWSTLESRPLAN